MTRGCDVAGVLRIDSRIWLSRDPLGEAGGLNLYGYVGNDPINGVDATGLDAVYLLQRNNAMAAGQGHAAALIGDDQNGWTYYSFAPNPIGPDYTVNRYATIQDALNDPEVARYDSYELYYTQRKDDLNAMLKASQDYNDSYKATSNNCGNEAAKTIHAAVPGFKNSSWRPKIVYADNLPSADLSGSTADLVNDYANPDE